MNSPFDMLEGAAHAAWERMIRVLFRPFSPKKWIGIGFAAWLATLARGSGGGGMAANLLLSLPVSSLHLSAASGIPGMGVAAAIVHWVQIHLVFAVIAVVFALVLGTILYLVLLWLDSRGRFVFLHCLAVNRVEIARPWRESEHPANSLFLWRLVFSMVLLTTGALLTGITAAAVLLTKGGIGGTVSVIVVAVLLGLVLGVTVVFTKTFLDAFVVPLMYRYRLRATAAWGYFLRLFRLHWGRFLLYAIAALVLHVAFGLGVLLLAVLTLGALQGLLMIPFAGTVILLPAAVFFRCFSVYFLEQFHPDYRIMDFPPSVADNS